MNREGGTCQPWSSSTHWGRWEGDQAVWGPLVAPERRQVSSVRISFREEGGAEEIHHSHMLPMEHSRVRNKT